ncbi:MAG TPA: PAS domain S-box protein [Pyrinomonadaceae bacterium]|nr:PAS domain S-box protein [Pyrinomonadaceae bacterium]
MPHSNLEKFFLSSIVESSYDSIITIDFNIIVTSWNKAAERLYGYSASESIGKSMTMLTLSEDFNEILSNIDKVRHNKEVVVFQTERVRKDNNRIILEVVMSPVKDDKENIVGVSTIARDITDRDRAARALQAKQNLQKLIEAQEDERKRIARDLHDELGQQLTVLRMQLESTKNSCKDEETCHKIEQLQLIAEEIDKGVDFLAWELRPSTLDDLGLCVAIGNYVQQWSHHSGIKAELLRTSLKKIRLAPTIETNLYRIVQEALNNIHKYASATNVEVILEKRDDLIVLIIEDNGVGFNPKDKKKLSKGLGLTGMKERAELMGGTFEIESEIGRGTTVFIRIQASAIREEGTQ